jgi:hypothetical protein
LNGAAIGRLIHNEDESFVDRLAGAMREGMAAPRRLEVSATAKRALDQERMIDTHRTLLDWFMQGGQPASARAWTRATPASTVTT